MEGLQCVLVVIFVLLIIEESLRAVLESVLEMSLIVVHSPVVNCHDRLCRAEMSDKGFPIKYVYEG